MAPRIPRSRIRQPQASFSILIMDVIFKRLIVGRHSFPCHNNFYYTVDLSVKTTNEGLTPLHLSARYLPWFKDPDVEDQERKDEKSVVTSTSTSRRAVQLLVMCRVHINVKDIYGVTPLHMACIRGNLAALEVLIRDPTIELDIRDNNQDTPLHKACLTGDPEIVRILIAQMNARKISLDLQNDEKQTPLHIACKEGYPDVVKLILQYKRQTMVMAEDNEKNTPLHLACESGSKEVVEILIHNGANVMAVEENQITPLHIAARMGFTDIAKILVEVNKEIIGVTDSFQRTPLHRAAQYNECEIIDFLLDK